VLDGIGVYLPYFVQSGFRATTHCEFLYHDVSPRGAPSGKRGNMFVGPQLGLFGRPNNHVSLLAGARVRHLTAPIDGRIYFSGEALSIDNQATVPGAMQSAHGAVKNLLRDG